jgi:hypothetical protein
MGGAFRDFRADFSRFPVQIAAAALLLSGFVVCLALASLVAFVALGQTARGFTIAGSIMSLERLHMPFIVRALIETCNWLALAVMVLICARSVVKSFQSALQPSSSLEDRVYDLSSESIGLPGYRSSSAANV